MEVALKVMFITSMITFVLGNVMIFAFKKPEATYWSMYVKGSFIVRWLDKYVEPERVSAIKLLLNVSAFTFMSSILITLAAGLVSRF